MIDNLGSYPSMKESRVRWVGAIPSHWVERRAKYLYREIDDRADNGAEELLSVSHLTGVTPRSQKNVTMFMAESTVGYKLCIPGDLVVNTMWAWMGALGVSKCRGVVSPSYGVYRPYTDSPLSPAFGELLLRSPAYVSEYNCRSTGISTSRLRLYSDRLLSMPVVCPPIDEQVAIVRFLDHADRVFLRYLVAKRKLLALLNEQKQAIIHRAVTRGLDPHVRLKPSGIDWLGDIPDSWTLRRLKFVARVNSGQVDPREPNQRTKTLIAPNHIKKGVGQILYRESAEAQGADSGKYEVNPGQVIYSKIRPNLRKAAIADDQCLCSADMYPLSVREDQLRSKYFLFLLLSEPFTRYVVDCSMRVAMPKVNREALGEAWLWYPSLDEQDAVLSHVESACAPADAAISGLEREVALVRELRDSLVARAVTGQVDIRHLANLLGDPSDIPSEVASADGSLDEAEPDAEEAVA